MVESEWRPAASLVALKARAGVLADIRSFFARNNVLEVETPVLSAAGTTDPNIESFSTTFCPEGSAGGTGAEMPLYLATSPEFHMKRLLAAGSGPIYQIGRVFRQGETGRLHNPEFTLLEWYRPGFDLHDLMQEVDALVKALLVPQQCMEATEFVTYQEAFGRHIAIDPLTDSTAQLIDCADRQGIDAVGLTENDRDSWLDLLMSHCVQPKLGKNSLCFLYDYPASQASLARIKNCTPPVAERFELFINGTELANGYYELQDACEQAARFATDMERRREAGLPRIPADQHLLGALKAGLPDCSGVALGLDRLLHIKLGTKSIHDCLAFPLRHA